MPKQKVSTDESNTNTMNIKRQFFIPDYGVTVEAETLEQAQAQAEKDAAKKES